MFKNKGQKIILSLVFVVLFVAVAVKVFSPEYTRSAFVQRIRGNEIIFIDGQGNLWGWEKEKNEDFHLGERVSLVFHNNNTDEIVEDDIILRIEK